MRSVETTLASLPGVTVEHVGLEEPAVIHVEGDQTSRDEIRAAVEGAGYRIRFEPAT